MHVELLNLGWFTSSAGLWRRGDPMERQARFPVPAYVIETPAERVLVDTGLHPAAIADPVAHYDGAGGLALLPPAVSVYVQRREWTAGRAAAAIRRNFLQPGDYACVADRVVLVDGDHDLLGDGSVTLLLTPGHTPGHQSVRVGERLVIGGDVTHFADGLDDLRFPLFADDAGAQRASAARLRSLRDAGATVLPGHDSAVLVPGPVALS